MKEYIREAGLLPGFDGYFTKWLLQENNFFPRLEKAFVNYIARENKYSWILSERFKRNCLPIKYLILIMKECKV
jgi:hypothetical protein